MGARLCHGLGDLFGGKAPMPQGLRRVRLSEQERLRGEKALGLYLTAIPSTATRTSSVPVPAWLS